MVISQQESFAYATNSFHHTSPCCCISLLKITSVVKHAAVHLWCLITRITVVQCGEAKQEWLHENDMLLQLMVQQCCLHREKIENGNSIMIISLVRSSAVEQNTTSLQTCFYNRVCIKECGIERCTQGLGEPLDETGPCGFNQQHLPDTIQLFPNSTHLFIMLRLSSIYLCQDVSVLGNLYRSVMPAHRASYDPYSLMVQT